MIFDVPLFLFGLGVVGVGVVFAKFGTGLPDSIPSGDDERHELAFYERRARRRNGVALLFILCGVLLSICGLLDAKTQPQLGFYLALAATALLLWAILLAVVDWMLTSSRAKRELRTVESQRAQIERDLQRYREQRDQS